ncbi:hypothetical protein [Azoarcus sp. KH32C]|nr:hypothetical protein [Azoarcus sp. KH32C]
MPTSRESRLRIANRRVALALAAVALVFFVAAILKFRGYAP